MILRGSISKLTLAGFVAAIASCERESAEVTPAETTIEESEMTTPDAPAPAPPPVVRTGDPVTDDVAYLHKQSLIAGHMIAFFDLYRIGEYDAADAHLVRPDSDIYASLIPAFEARLENGFAGALAQVAATAGARGDIEETYQFLMTEMAGSEPELSVQFTMFAVADIIRSASEAFTDGVDDVGAVSDIVQYQYGYGLMAASRDLLSKVSTNDINEAEAIAVTHEQLDAIAIGFPALTAAQTDGDAAMMQSAADVIERAAQRLG